MKYNGYLDSIWKADFKLSQEKISEIDVSRNWGGSCVPWDRVDSVGHKCMGIYCAIRDPSKMQSFDHRHGWVVRSIYSFSRGPEFTS